MMQPQGVRLRAQLAAGAHPAQQRGARTDFRQQLIAERVQREDRRPRGHGAVVGERSVDATAGQLRRDERHIARRRAHDQTHVGPIGRYPSERVHPQQRARQGRDLVGGHRPRADAQQQHERGGERDQSQSPQGDRAHTPRSAENEVDRGGLLVSGALRGNPCSGHDLRRVIDGRRGPRANASVVSGREVCGHGRQPDRRSSVDRRPWMAAVTHQQLLQRALREDR